MTRVLCLLAAAASLAASGIVHGLRTDRWGIPEDVHALAARLEGVGHNLGEWAGETVEIDPAQLATAKVVGHLARHYEDRRTGERVTLIVVCGRPGPISLHPPDVCYRGAGYEIAGEPERVAVAGTRGSRPAEFWSATFRKPGVADPQVLRIFWAWSAGETWQAPKHPRFDWEFAHSPALFKLYVVRRADGEGATLDAEPCLDFLRVLLPELEKCLSLPETPNT